MLHRQLLGIHLFLRLFHLGNGDLSSRRDGSDFHRFDYFDLFHLDGSRGSDDRLEIDSQSEYRLELSNGSTLGFHDSRECAADTM